MAWSSSQAALLVAAAEAAMTYPAAAPEGFLPLYTLAGDRTARPPQPNGQGLLMMGLNQDTGKSFAVLALGMPWEGLINAYNAMPPADPGQQTTVFGQLTQVDGARIQVPAAITADGAVTQFTSLFIAIYSQLWRPIWNAIAQFRKQLEGADDFYVTGLGPGAPLALLAGLDLRSSHSSPTGIAPLSKSPVVYAFSVPPVADTEFQIFYDKHVTETYCVNAQKQNQPVDLFPSAPGASAGYVLPGRLQPLAASAPKIADPWLERSGGFYGQALGAARRLEVEERQPSPLPRDYDSHLAHALANLCGAANELRERPLAISQVPIAPYQLVDRISSNGVVWGGSFHNPGSAFAFAFRDTVSWEELLVLQMEKTPVEPPFLAPSSGQVQKSALEIYLGLRDSLLTICARPLLDNLPIYFAGYGFGGALAALAAADIENQRDSLKRTVQGVYGFGSSSFADPFFGMTYRELLDDRTFQVTRPADFMPGVPLPRIFLPVGNRVPLVGSVENDDPASYHTLKSYLDLLQS